MDPEIRENGNGHRRGNLVQYVVDTLRQKILCGTYQPGQPLPAEGKLAQSLEVSRTVIREAMCELRAQGLVEVSQGRRPHVKSMDSQAVIATLDTLLQRSQATLVHLMQVRRPLEAEIAALAAEHATPEDLRQIEKAINDLRIAPDLTASIEADASFHRALAIASGNPLFVLFMDTVRALLVRCQRTLFPLAGLVITLEGHTSIFEQVQAGDPAEARKTMLKHLDEAQQALLQVPEEEIETH